MDRFERIYTIHNLLCSHKYPISMDIFCEKLEYSKSTVIRDINALRNIGAPVAYNHEAKGYFLDTRNAEHPYQLPGLWFNASELYALLVGQSLLTHIQPGVLEDYIRPLKTRIEQLLHNQHAGSPELSHRIRILQTASRSTNLQHFHKITAALVHRQQLRILYHGRARDETQERDISPQRLVYYRDNWYLDAWCHNRNDLRTFALDRIHPITQLELAAKNIDDHTLDQQLTSSYGIFDGEAQHTAILHFGPHAAKWIADEHWHPQQHSQTLPDGGHELRIPYNNPTELIMDILKYGPDVEVLAPASLRQVIQEKLQASLKIYQTDNHNVSL